MGGEIKKHASLNAPDTPSPSDAYITQVGASIIAYGSTATSGDYLGATLNEVTVQLQNTGNNNPYNNMAPSTCINHIIALQGVFPSRG